jgi:hypothetical protein
MTAKFSHDFCEVGRVSRVLNHGERIISKNNDNRKLTSPTFDKTWRPLVRVHQVDFRKPEQMSRDAA